MVYIRKENSKASVKNIGVKFWNAQFHLHPSMQYKKHAIAILYDVQDLSKGALVVLAKMTQDSLMGMGQQITDSWTGQHFKLSLVHDSAD